MEDLIQIQRAAVNEHIREEIAKNWNGVHTTFVQDENAFYDAVPLNVRYPGIQGIKDFYSVLDTAFPDYSIDVWGEYDTPGCSIREVTISGTHKGDYCGIPATGRRVRVQLASFFLFGKGIERSKLLAERIYFDNETILRQLRGELDASSVLDFTRGLR